MNPASVLRADAVDGRSLTEEIRIRGRKALSRRVGIDTRALAALRISLGLLILADLFVRSRDLVAHYTDTRVLPRTALYEQFPGIARLSFHTVSGTAGGQAVLFLVAGGFALALLFGYRTRLVTLLSLVFLVSLQTRNPILLNAGDSVLRRLLFWSLFLPLGERWSVDSLRAERPRGRVASVASAALLLQVVLVYTMNGALKLRGDLWVSGDAIAYVFSLDQLTVLLGGVLAQYLTLLGLFDRVCLVLVISSVLLVLLTGWSRAAFASLFVGMHPGMFLTMRLGLFPLVSMASLLPFFPGVVWERVE
ncbi:HTTM domain-containing protein [Haladaptatus sp. NG-WS-4]